MGNLDSDTYDSTIFSVITAFLQHLEAAPYIQAKNRNRQVVLVDSIELAKKSGYNRGNYHRVSSPAMTQPNQCLEGVNARPRTAAEARALLGRRIEYLRNCDVDRSGRGYFFPRIGVVQEVAGRNVRLDESDWLVLGDFHEVRVIAAVDQPDL